MANYYPPPAFHFRVNFDDISDNAKDYSFQSVSGLTVSLETETIKEGGENRFVHTLPVRSKYEDLVLKRGVVTDSKVIEWIRRAIEDFEIEPINIEVLLLDPDQNPLITWKCKHVWPKKWSMSELGSEKSELLIETLELNCNFFSVEYA